MRDNKQVQFRLHAISGIALLLAILFIALLYVATIANGLNEQESADLNTVATTANVAAARGNITDRYGRTLVTNRTEYNVTLDVGAMGKIDDQLATITQLLDICRKQKVQWTANDLPISNSTPYTFTTKNPFLYQGSDGKWSQTRLGKLCKAMNWSNSSSTTAPDLIKQMKESFHLDTSKYSESQTRELLGILYSSYLREEEVLYTTYVFAEDVNINLISVIKEKNLPGVDIVPMATREYDTDYAAILLGQTGSISAESWDAKKDYYEKNKYTMDSVVGLSGAESAFEQYLRGTSGTERVTVGTDGKTLTQSYVHEPKIGNNVSLTIDIKLQAVAEKALNDQVPSINNGRGGGAAVVIDISDGSVLAAASYPTFSAAKYTDDYKKLYSDTLKPLYNRAFLGTYAPGSTYKICTGTAGINSGAITTATTFICHGFLDYYGSIFKCWEHGGNHGSEDLSDAIRDSCNVYFYNVGIKTGIDALTKTSRAYGLGDPSGIELTESTGVNAGPAYSEKMGTTWYRGNTLSAAIGQSDNQFTPLQLANYIATFINGGTRYKAHLLKTVKSNDNSKILYQYKPSVLNTVPLSENARQAIKKGMGEVIAADKITDFEDLEKNGIKVGCKTGTAQLGNTGLDNGLLVSFAPYDHPKIAICTVVEKAPSGASTAGITAAIMNYYFSQSATLQRVEAENQMLS